MSSEAGREQSFLVIGAAGAEQLQQTKKKGRFQ
jgi:hypothetical protein